MGTCWVVREMVSARVPPGSRTTHHDFNPLHRNPLPNSSPCSAFNGAKLRR